MVKALTAVLKFIVDASTMSLLPPQYRRKCLNFTTETLKFIGSNLREHSVIQLPVTEEVRKDIFVCLKSSFTYGAKLLNLVLKYGEAESEGVGNELFNLLVSVEEFLGYGFATRLTTVVQPWIPDLILALGSWSLLREVADEATDSAAMVSLPTWYYVIARVQITIELGETEGSSDEVCHHFPAFRRFVEAACTLLKANSEVLDAVGAKLLSGALGALESRNLEVLLGLLQFVWAELVEEGEWGSFKMMLACVGEIYNKLEIEGGEDGGDGREKLWYSAKALVEPVWRTFIMYDDDEEAGSHAMEEEEE